ncbi:MAG: hypothetical protein ABIW82_17970 [Dokdonella sp.]
MSRHLLVAAIAMANLATAHAADYFFSTGNPDSRLAAGSRPAGSGQLEIETADDFVLTSPDRIDSASIVGWLPATASAASVDQVSVKIYRVFPLDSSDPPSGHVPTRVNSPSDTVFQTRSSGTNSLTYSVSVIAPGYFLANSVLIGINPFPNQTTGGEGPVNGSEAQFILVFHPPLSLASGHYFFVPQVHLVADNFLWSSASRPIAAPGTPFTNDLQSWIRNASLSPDWLRVGTDIIGGTPTFNHAFQLIGVDDSIFSNGFD